MCMFTFRVDKIHVETTTRNLWVLFLSNYMYNKRERDVRWGKWVPSYVLCFAYVLNDCLVVEMDTYTGWPCRKTSFLDLIFTLRSLTFYRPPLIECDRDEVNVYTRTKLYLAHLRPECDSAWVSRILTFCMSGRLTLFFCLLHHHLKEWRVVVTFPIGILILLILLIRLINMNANLQERTNECRQECIDQGELVSAVV